MRNTDAVAAALVAANGVVDKLELATDMVSYSDRLFLAAYQTKLASGFTKKWEDLRFLQIFTTFLNAVWNNKA